MFLTVPVLFFDTIKRRRSSNAVLAQQGIIEHSRVKCVSLEKKLGFWLLRQLNI